MRNLSYSFKRDGTFFVFDIDTGATVPVTRADGRPAILRSAKSARMAWIKERGV